MKTAALRKKMNTYITGEIQTYSEVMFDVLNPTEDLVDTEDIAHALSNVCRFGGHTNKFYSVAEHSIFCSLGLTGELGLALLLHDAAEAYIGDVVQPIKALVPEFKKIEFKIIDTIYKKFGLKPYSVYKKEIKPIDDLLLGAEALKFLGVDITKKWNTYEHLDKNHIKNLSVKLVGMDSITAKMMFIKRFQELTNTRPGTVIEK